MKRFIWQVKFVWWLFKATGNTSDVAFYWELTNKYNHTNQAAYDAAHDELAGWY